MTGGELVVWLFALAAAGLVISILVDCLNDE